MQPTFTDLGLDHPSPRPGKAAFYGPQGADHGFIYSGEPEGPRLWRAQLSAEGQLSAWAPLLDLPSGTGNQRGDFFVAGATLFVVRGARVFRGDLADDGAIAPWIELATLPEDQIDLTWGDGHLEGAAYGLIDDHIYLTGPKRVFHARLDPAPCAH